MNETALPAGLFTEIKSDRFDPSEFTRGPWRPDAQHGGPPAALLMYVTEPLVEDDEFVSHVEIELLRPVPLETLNSTVERRRISRRVHRVVATLWSGDTAVARSNALALQRSPLPEPGWRPEAMPATSPPPVDARVEPPRWASGTDTTYHRNAMEHRFTDGTFREAGPATDWQRLRLPVVAGSSPSGLQRLAASADFGSGISAVYTPDSGVGLINANLAISIFRYPVGEWISLDAVTEVGPQGTGLGISTIGDIDGRVGIATQSLLGYTMEL